MTRETKIGLLVGLAFIIVIGILLADYSANTARPPQAAVGDAAQNVRDSARVPGSQVQAPLLTVPDIIPRPAPGQDGSSSGRRTTDVRIGPGNDGRTRNIDARERGSDQDGPIIQEDRPGTSREGSAERQDNSSGTENPGNGNAGRGDGRSREGTESDDSAAQPTDQGVREITAKQGDTVSRWARQYLGSNSKTNCDAIIKLNPQLKAHPNRIVVDETYKIPAVAGRTPAPTAPEASTEHSTPVAPVAAREREGTVVSYTTKPGDSLWKIAVEQCGSGSLVAKIRELNRDVLKNGDRVSPNMTLKLPPKQLASAR